MGSSFKEAFENLEFLHQKEQSTQIVNRVIEALSDRGGFDGWWDGVDDETQKEIKADLTEVVSNVLKHV